MPFPPLPGALERRFKRAPVSPPPVEPLVGAPSHPQPAEARHGHKDRPDAGFEFPHVPLAYNHEKMGVALLSGQIARLTSSNMDPLRRPSLQIVFPRLRGLGQKLGKFRLRDEKPALYLAPILLRHTFPA